jgi:hypothetical protein
MALERSRRWPPRQRIQLTESGKAAVATYQAKVAEARSAGRPSNWLEAELATWSGTLGIRAADGVLLEELANQGCTVNDLARAVESCGLRAPEVKAGVDRLYGAELIEPPAQKVEAPPSDPRRFY